MQAPQGVGSLVAKPTDRLVRVSRLQCSSLRSAWTGSVCRPDRSVYASQHPRPVAFGRVEVGYARCLLEDCDAFDKNPTGDAPETCVHEHVLAYGWTHRPVTRYSEPQAVCGSSIYAEWHSAMCMFEDGLSCLQPKSRRAPRT